MSEMAESHERWRTIVDGDVWFFAKAIPIEGGGSIGFCAQPSANEVVLYAARGMVEASIRFKRDEADQLIAFLEECYEKSKTIKSQKGWGKEGTFIIREMKTHRGVLVHIASLHCGAVSLKMALYDTGDENHYFSAVALRVSHLDSQRYKLLMESLKKQLAYVDETQEKLRKARDGRKS